MDLARNSEQWRGVAGAGGGKKVAETVIAAASETEAAVAKIIEKYRGDNDPLDVLEHL